MPEVIKLPDQEKVQYFYYQVRSPYCLNLYGHTIAIQGINESKLSKLTTCPDCGALIIWDGDKADVARSSTLTRVNGHRPAELAQ